MYARARTCGAAAAAARPYPSQQACPGTEAGAGCQQARPSTVGACGGGRRLAQGGACLYAAACKGGRGGDQHPEPRQDRSVASGN